MRLMELPMKRVMTLPRMATCTLALALTGATLAWAQETANRPVDHTQLRHQIYVMEGALSRAVEFGAQSLNREVRAFMPEAFVLAGQARARGVYLDGYGIFFDVEVPILQQSMMWSLRTMLFQDEAGLQKAITDLREVARTAPNPAARASAERALDRIQLQLAPLGVQGSAPSNPFAAAMQNAQQAQRDLGPSPIAMQPPPSAAPPPGDAGQNAPAPDDHKVLPMDKLWVKDPNRAYTEAVQRALADAMIDFSAPMQIRPDEWLTVAARDNYQRDSLAPSDPLEEVETILMRIKGTDLMAYRSGQISKDEALKRVVISAF